MTSLETAPSSDDTRVGPPRPTPRYLNRDEAALYLSEQLRGTVSTKAMSGWGKKGPPYRVFRGKRGERGGNGRWAVYTIEDLDAWIETQLADGHGSNKLPSAG